MSASTKPSWERFGDAMLDWCGYVAARARDRPRPPRRRPGPGLAADDARDRGAWPRPGSTSCYTRLPRPRQDASAPDRRVLRRAARPRVGADAPPAAVLHLHDQRASSTPSSCGRCRSPSSASSRRRSSSTRSSPGFPQNAEAWTFYVAIIVIQTIVDRRRRGRRREGRRAERGAPPGASRGSRRRSTRTPASTPSC